MRFQRFVGIFLGLVAAAWTSHAHAAFDEWRISQVYSNASGSVQYVDFVLPAPSDDESFLSGRQLTAGLNSNALSFGSNLPSVPVANQHFLVATPGFAAIAGVTPDYTLPAAPFFNPGGDTLNYAFVDSFTFGAGALPLDGLHALNRDNSTPVNAPVNFAGQTGFVPEPATWTLALVAGLGLLAAGRRRRRPGHAP